MTIDAEKPRVNTQRQFDEDVEEEKALGALLAVRRLLEKTAPDQFAKVLEREWSNVILDRLANSTLKPVQVRGHLTLAAKRRATCMGVLDEFLARVMPAPRTLDQARASTGFTDARYQPGDEPEELIDELLPRDGVTMIGGQSGAGKTFVLIGVALALATGADFLGYPVRERVGVIIAAAEGAGTIAARIEAAKRHAGLEGDVPIGVIHRVPDLKDPAQCDAFAADVQLLAQDMEMRYGLRVGMLGLDTVTSAFSIENENDNSEAAHVCKVLAWLGTSTGMAIVPLHHFGKSADQGLRGASAWRANVDHGLSVIADRSGSTGKVGARSINMMKSRIGEEGPICGFELKQIKLGVNRYGKDISTCVAIRTAIPVELPKPKKVSEGDLAFAASFNECAISAHDSGSKRRIFGDGPVVPAVQLEHVLREFKRRYAADEDQPDQRREAMKKAWQRAKKAAIESRAYVTETDVRGNIWIWLAKAENQNRLL